MSTTGIKSIKTWTEMGQLRFPKNAGIYTFKH